MGRNLDDIIKNLPPRRQAKIAALSEKKVEEMIRYSATLADVRKAMGKTQDAVAKELGIKQNAVSQLEKRADTYVSTLRRYMKSLGMTLELSVVNNEGARIALPDFLPWHEGKLGGDDLKSSANASKLKTDVSSTPGRSAASKASPAPGTVTKVPARQAAKKAAVKAASAKKT